MATIKLYCENCIFFLAQEKSPYDFGPPHQQLEKCLAPENFKDTAISPKSLPISQPKVINKFNSCLWYQASEQPSSSSSSSSSL